MAPIARRATFRSTSGTATTSTPCSSGKFLHKKALERGVKYKSCHVTDVNARTSTAISPRSRPRKAKPSTADFFVDCTGFAALLIQKALADAVRQLLRQPLQRRGRRDADTDGRVHSIADGVDRDEARLGVEDPADQPLRQRLRVQLVLLLGRSRPSTSCAKPWGCSSPTSTRPAPEDADRPRYEALEPELPCGRTLAGLHRAARGHGAALHPAHCHGLRRISGAAATSASGSRRASTSASTSTSRARATTSSPTTRPTRATDTDYWRANAANLNISDPLKELYNLWMAGQQHRQAGQAELIGQAYPVFSWYCIMAGMGIFPDAKSLRPPNASEKQFSMAEIDNLLTRSAINFRDQGELLADDTAEARRRVAADLFLVTQFPRSAGS